MSSIDTSRARFHGLDDDQADVLYLVTRWYNSKPFQFGEETLHIAQHQELPLRDMFDAWGGHDYDDYADAHERLLERGFLDEDWLCRRKIDWLPTEQGIRAIRDTFKGQVDELGLRPDWAREEDSGPIFGDPNELLLHRKGVEAAGRRLQGISWVQRMSWYPAAPGSKESADIKIWLAQHVHDWKVEVLTNTNNADQWEAKWNTFRNGFDNVFWIFEDRSTMCSFFNTLHDRGVYDLDGGRFSKPYKNWSAQAVTRKLWRSKDPNDPDAEAGDLAHTITGVVEADMETFVGWFDEYFAENSPLHPTDR